MGFRLHILITLLTALALGGQTVYTESFREDTATDWTFGNDGSGFTPELTAATSVDSSGDGWLRLTTNGGNQSTFALFDTPINFDNNRVTITFSYTAWGGSGADGITWFLQDANETFDPGAFGGSLGYANRTGVDGMDGGFLGIGVDEFGNFSNDDEGRNGGFASGLRPGWVSLRGPGDGQTGYEWLDGADTGEDLDFADRPGSGPGTDDNLYRFKMEIDENERVQVFINTTPDSDPEDWDLIFSYDDASSILGNDRPDDIRFGFTSSTGGSNNFHEVRDLTIFASATIDSSNAYYWDAGHSNDNWGTGGSGSRNNWVGDVNPPTSANTTDVFFEDDGSQSGLRNVNLQGDRTVRSITFDYEDGYSTNEVNPNRDLILDSNSQFATINVTDFNGVSSSTNYQINTSVQVEDALEINHFGLLSTLTFGRDVTFTGSSSSNDFQINGIGTTIFESIVTGADDLVIDSSGETIFESTLTVDDDIDLVGPGVTRFEGATTAPDEFTMTDGSAFLNGNLTTDDIILDGGTLLLGANDRIDDGANINLNGGTLATQGFSDVLDGFTLSSNSTIDLGAGTSVLRFTDTNVTTSGDQLTIAGWSGDFSGGGTDQLIFDDTLGATFLDNVFWADQGILGARQLASGEIVPIPEPTTIAAGIALLGLIFWHHRRQRQQRESVSEA